MHRRIADLLDRGLGRVNWGRKRTYRGRNGKSVWGVAKTIERRATPTLSAPRLTAHAEATGAAISATSSKGDSPAATFADKILKSAKFGDIPIKRRQNSVRSLI